MTYVSTGTQTTRPRGGNRKSLPLALVMLKLRVMVQSRIAPDAAAALLAKTFTHRRNMPLRASDAGWDVGARRKAVSIGNGQVVQSYDWGKGPVVVLVHGFGGRAAQMAGFVAPLVAAGYRVVTFDGPAHGASAGTHTALPDFVRAIEKVAESIGPLHAVIGHSMGAAAMAATLARGLEAERAVLIAPPAYPGTYLAQLGTALGATDKVIGRAQAWIEDTYKAPFDEFRTALNTASLDMPGLVIHDAHDRKIPMADGQAAADSWPGAHMMVTEGLGHARILQDPHVIAAVTDFVDQA